jgi:CRP-like cAMP-binding protein
MTTRLLHYFVELTRDWFNELPPAVRNDVLSRVTGRSYARGQRLHSRGDACDGVYCIASGCVRVSGTSRDGDETILDFYGPGMWFGEVAALGGLPRMHDATAYEETALLHLAQPVLEELVAAHPAFSRALLRLEAQRLGFLLMAIETYSAQSMEQRLANRLLMLAASFGQDIDGPHRVKIGLHLPQEVLADLIGTTRQRVGQILNDWQSQSLVAHGYGHVLLRDRASFERIITP